ncbi:HlyC/CorC family transporter [Candidatus Symbiobacter mobilis]|uniref:Magnesium and cobalt efflux protein CorC n=1 Tax=Candidatus Symbiobacter mobilis CR TaxID=946483 RepID=U5N619_9BURK|nr:transporter associated domain-containing protein [Candidatus Symbiobacter mobilis]AGX86730.1 magnesium/cobalt transporter [Candidatus Symbiobacter mobilis CR]
MNDHSAPPLDGEDKRTLLQKIAEFIHPGPDSTSELLDTLLRAERQELIPTDSRHMLEGVIRMAEMSAGDVMVPSARMDMIDLGAMPEVMLDGVICSGHSRYPVFEGRRENIVGVLLAKDLLKWHRNPGIEVRSLLRPAVFVPESKRLNDLLRDFQSNHNHLAIVIDEYGEVAGLITIEDVLEVIVGDIEDEFDSGKSEGSIYDVPDHSYTVSGDSPIERVEYVLGIHIDRSNSAEEQELDTIGGLIAHRMGHVPQRGEHYELCGLRFSVVYAKGGYVQWFNVRHPDDAPQ